MKSKIICFNCYFKERYEQEDWCKLIENEGGGSEKANRTECELYLKRGTEPKWLCSVCGKNTYGDSSTSEGGKHYCSDCYWKMEHKRHQREERKKKLENIKSVAVLLNGNKKLAKRIIEIIKL